MEIFSWFKNRGSPQRKAKRLYRRGMLRARLRQHSLAISDYGDVVELDGAPYGLVAMALYNRALVHHAMGNGSCAVSDLKRILAMSEPVARVKAEARRKLLRMKRSAERMNSGL